MAVLPIYNCFHPILREKTKKVEEFDENLQRIIQDMFDSMYNADGIGLAANQVGLDISIFVIDEGAKDEENPSGNPIVVINPEIISFSDKIVSFQEGCLSIPKVFESVDRPAEIEVLFYDEKGREHRVVFDKFPARIFQHELDHLNGVLFFDRVLPLKRALMRNKLKMVERNRIETKYDMIDLKGNIIIHK